jgi:hypothetical protein
MRAVIAGAGAVGAVVAVFVLWAAIDELRTSSRSRKLSNGAVTGAVLAIYIVLPVVVVSAVLALIVYNVS